jgi:hypothetical protein
MKNCVFGARARVGVDLNAASLCVTSSPDREVDDPSSPPHPVATAASTPVTIDMRAHRSGPSPLRASSNLFASFFIVVPLLLNYACSTEGTNDLPIRL